MARSRINRARRARNNRVKKAVPMAVRPGPTTAPAPAPAAPAPAPAPAATAVAAPAAPTRERAKPAQRRPIVAAATRRALRN